MLADRPCRYCSDETTRVLFVFTKLVCDLLEFVREPEDASETIDEEFGIDIVEQ